MTRTEKKEILHKIRNQHIDDFIAVMRKCGLFSYATPMEFRDAQHQQKFWAEFNALGHDHQESMRCKCCIALISQLAD
jgi:hypothetical protein